MLRLLFFKIIAQPCIVLICGMIIKKNQHLAEFVLHLIMFKEKYLVYLSGLVPVQGMPTTLSVTLKRLRERTHLDSCRGWNRALLKTIIEKIHVI